MYRFTGTLKNAVPEGYGAYKMGWEWGSEYAGEWKNGKPDGYGLYKWYSNSLLKWQFKRFFRNGKPVEGLLCFIDDRAFRVFYSGEVKYPEVNGTHPKLLPHGYGRFYTALNLNGYSLAAGCYNEGQFFNGAPTGFGIYNMAPEDLNHLTTLKTGLLLCGLVVKNFSDLKVFSSLFETNSNVPAGKYPVLEKLLPEISKVDYGTIQIDASATY